MTHPQAPAPRRILIVRLSALGDIVMASGLIAALHALHPQAEISWLCEPACAPLLTHNPRLKQVLIWPRQEWQAHWRAKAYGRLVKSVLAMRRQLREQSFDWVLDAQGLLKSGLLSWMTAAPRRVSIIAREGSHIFFHERVTPPPGADPVMGSEYRFLAQYLGASGYDFDLAVGQSALVRAKAALQQALPLGPERTHGPSPLAASCLPSRSAASGTQARVAFGQRPLVALCPFTTRPQKHWVQGNWIALGRDLHRAGLQPIILGGPGDQAGASQLTQGHPELVSLVGQLRLDESVALISLCQLLIGVDTGLTHMGTALGIPTLALFGSTRPYLQGPSASTRVLYDGLPCSPCRRRPTCGGAFTCMSDLDASRVRDEALALLNEQMLTSTATPPMPSAHEDPAH